MNRRHRKSIEGTSLTNGRVPVASYEILLAMLKMLLRICSPKREKWFHRTARCEMVESLYQSCLDDPRYRWVADRLDPLREYGPKFSGSHCAKRLKTLIVEIQEFHLMSERKAGSYALNPAFDTNLLFSLIGENRNKDFFENKPLRGVPADLVILDDIKDGV